MKHGVGGAADAAGVSVFEIGLGEDALQTPQSRVQLLTRKSRT